MKAAANGHDAMVTKLGELGADLDAADNVSTFDSIAIKGMTMPPEVLFDALFYQEGETAVMKAVANGHDAVVMKLAELGADLAAANNVIASTSI